MFYSVFLVRFFGWAMLSLLIGFLINNALVVVWDYPPVSQLFSGEPRTGIMMVVYIASFWLAVAIVIERKYKTLRADAKAIGDFNLYLIRSLFWSVLLVGLVDAAIALMRVEKVLPDIFGDELATQLIRAHFVGPYIHLPLIVFGFILGKFTNTLGFLWLALLIVFAELLIVISRFLFSYEQALMGDLVRYWYAALFLFASAYTLLDDCHVRVDVLYAGFTNKTKGFINAIGAVLLGLTTCWTIIFIGFGSKQAIINSPIMNLEVTQTGGTGMFIKYQMAAFLGIFAITMLIQFVSMLFSATADYKGEEKIGSEIEFNLGS